MILSKRLIYIRQLVAQRRPVSLLFDVRVQRICELDLRSFEKHLPFTGPLAQFGRLADDWPVQLIVCDSPTTFSICHPLDTLVLLDLHLRHFEL